MDDKFNQHPELIGLFITGAYTYEIAEYLKRKALGKKVYLIGFDLVPADVKFLQEDVIDFLISQSPDLQGYTGIYTLCRQVMFHEEVEDEMNLPSENITKENLHSYRHNRFARQQKGEPIYMT